MFIDCFLILIMFFKGYRKDKKWGVNFFDIIEIVKFSVFFFKFRILENCIN